MMKNMKTKIITSFIMLMIVMTALGSCKSYANTVDESYIDNSSINLGEGVTSDDGVTRYQISYDTYWSSWVLFCCQYGRHIPSQTQTTKAYIGDKITSSTDIIEKSELQANSERYIGKKWKSEEIAYYALRNTKVCNPKAAYILNEAKNNVNDAGSNDDNSVQHAWWTTSENVGTEVSDNSLSLEAKAYQNFVEKIAKNANDVNNPSTYQTLTHTYEDGTEVSIQFPEIDTRKIESSFTVNSSEMTVNFNTDTQKYVIGPFTLDYTESTYNGIEFGAINGFDIYTDASADALSEEQWRFIFTQEHEDNRRYPSSGEKFYIEMNYIQNMTKITNIDIDYKYLIAGGQYQELVGTYQQYEWKLNRVGVESSKDSNGNYTQWEYEFTAKDQGLARESQQLGLLNKAARWYESTKIQVKVNQATLIIEKKAIDENGNELTASQVRDLFGQYQFFDFKVKITHSDGTVENSVVTVAAGSSALVGRYAWSDTEDAPTYEIEEVSTNNPHWAVKSISNEKGTLSHNTRVTAIAVNQLQNPKHNHIEITKTISGVADRDEEFKFEVVVTMPNGTTNTSTGTIVVPEGKSTGNVWKSDEYYWYGDKIPTFEIREIETEASKKYQSTINPSKGVLDGTGATIDVNAFNNEGDIPTPNIIKINKTTSEPTTEDELFRFQVEVTMADGTKDTEIVEIIVPKGQTTGKTWESKKYSWEADEEAPHFEIKELETEASKKYKPTITPSSGSLDGTKAEIEVTAVNRLDEKEYSNFIELIKTTSEPASEDELFKFSVEVTMADGTKNTEIAEITVPKGKTTGNVWKSKVYEWKEGEKAPTYEVKELETEASKKYRPEIDKPSGSLKGDQAKVIVNAKNVKIDTAPHKGYLTIEKDLADGQITDELFNFHVKVDGVKNTENGTVEFEVNIKAGEKAGPYEFLWEGDKAPTFTITEKGSNEVKNVNIEVTGASNVQKSSRQVTGQLTENGEAKVNVKFTNDMNKHSGNIKVIKEFFSTEKMTKEELKELASELNVKFDVEVTIKGTFVYGNEKFKNSTKTITQTLSKDNNWEFTIDNIVWYGSSVPTYTVREINLPEKWECRSINYSHVENSSTNSEGHNLVDGSTVEVTITNEIPSDTIIDLTFQMAGIVWVDDTLDEKNDIHNDGYYKAPNGVYDVGETLKENAEVTVYKVIYDAAGNEVSRTVATAYKDVQNNEITFPIVTKTDGKWDVPRIQVPVVTEEQKAAGYTASYDVEFAYDGQTYEPTEFLSYKVSSKEKDGYNKEYDRYYAKKNEGTTEQRAAEYRNTTTAGKKEYEKDSMAIETFNNSKNIVEVSGKTEIDSNGDTTGIVTLRNGEQQEVTYHSDNAGTEYPTQSKLNTVDSDGRVLDVFRATATTSAGSLTFPFDVDAYDGSSLTSVNKTVDDKGFHTSYKFIAVYNYCLNINLGLKTRDDVDIALTKNLDHAKVVVNEKMYQYNYSGLYDLTEQKVNTLSKDIHVENASQDIEYTLGLYKSDYYYRAEMYAGNSDLYDALQNFYATINKSVSDTEMDIYLTYKIKLQNSSSKYDVQINRLDDYYDSSLSLVTVAETKYLKTQTVGGTESDVNDTVVIANASDYADQWDTVKTGITGSDKDANGNNIVYNKMTATQLGILLKPGESKELMMTFKVKKGKDNEHGIEDSIALGQKCNVAEIASYTTFDTETQNYAGKIDRDSAPSNINISANNSKPWYEDDTFAAPRIKVNILDNKIRTINGVAWEDNSKDKNTEKPNPDYNQQVGNGIKDSDEKEIAGLTTELVEKIAVKNADGTYTEYNYIWPTDVALDCLNGKTIEEISGFDTTTETDGEGKYKFENVIAGDYVVKFTYGDHKIESADYSEAQYYNGQDYKSTRFKANLQNDTPIAADSYLDIDKINAYTEEKNTAVDSEVRRLEVVAKSREITYNNSSVMADYEGDQLYEDYWMFAETPKIDMNIELSNYGTEHYQYTVNHVDFGLEERPITRLTLDKQIEEMILTTSDGTNIMDAKYNISYAVADDGSITANVELDPRNSYGTDNLQALNRDQATNQGFRYINVDSSILEGTTITVKYKFTVLNTGEVDRTGKLATMVYSDDENNFVTAGETLSTELATYTLNGKSLKNDTKLGKYVGSIYYYGADGEQTDSVVTSTVRQLVDYIDNDVSFSGMLNASKDTSWSNITTAELKGRIDPSIITTTADGSEVIVDKDGVQYETQNRNNLVVSVDSADDTNTLNNQGFIVELRPYSVDNTNYSASMYLTTTKYVGSDSDDLQIDNIAEIIKYNNKVGRRDELSIAGNQNPATELEKDINLMTDSTLSSGMKYERDTSATEVITLSPPTGSGLTIWKMQIIASISIGLVIIAGGIVLIKKKVLK